MKDLTIEIEEKAKRYDEALGKAKKELDTCGSQDCDAARQIFRFFSELKESEDERIRKTLIHIVKGACDKYGIKYQGQEISEEKLLAWLEKQGEQDEECKEINLVEILKHYPKETELFSPLYGKLWLAEVDEKNEIITCYKHHLEKGCTRAVLEQEDSVSFYSNGTTGLPDFTISKDCMLFLYNMEKQDDQRSEEEVDNLHNYLYGEQKPIKEHNVCTFCEEKSGCVSPCPTKLIEEQKPASTVEPKFHEGDMIIHKELGGDFIHDPHKIIQVDILDKKYRLEGGLVAHFSEEDDWELVEQKPTDKVEPKFKVGDFVVNKFGHTKLITNIENDCYYATNIDDNTEWYGSIEYANIHFYKWTIQDAKDGDILANDDNAIIIFRKIGNKTWSDVIDFYVGYNHDSNKFNIQSGKSHYGNTNETTFKPAIEEKRNLLFQKMKEAGYEWDVEKKKLKKIEKNYIWSKDDDRIFDKLIKYLDLDTRYYFDKNDYDEARNWIKSIKERMQMQPMK